MMSKKPLENLMFEVLLNGNTQETHGREEVASALKAGFHDFMDRAEGDATGVLSTLRRQINFLKFPAMKKVLQNNDFDFKDLKKKKMAVYFVLPAGKMGKFNRFLRLGISRLLSAMEEETTIPKHPVIAHLDEFAVLGHMREIEDQAGQIRGFHCRLHIILQDLGQLKSLYKDRWETFLANSGILQFFGNNDLTTLQYIEDRLGKTAVRTARENLTHQTVLGTASHGMEMHSLLTAQEAARFFRRIDPLKRQLVLWDCDPMILQKIEYWNPKSPVYKYFKSRYQPL
ncbi:MAG: type IV secretory system conjugative DNA transfer family protein [Nitrospinales bacterium]